jgi:uncharacterized membrane protein HdeD (DUF308 family)
MQVIDQFFGWLMIAFGVAQCITSFRIHPSHLTAGLSATAVAIIAGGFLNVSRNQHSDGLTRAFSLITNLLILVLAVGSAWPLRYHLLHDWQKLGTIIAAALELFFAF